MRKGEKKWKRVLNKICGIILLLYVISYPILSMIGKYSDGPVASGEMRFQIGLAIRDVYVWEPKYMKVLPYDFNLLGAAYWEFVWLDRRFWHKNKPVYSTD